MKLRLLRPSVLALVAVLGLTLSASAQQQPFNLMAPVPLDTAVRYGVLPNGATYYIRHNAKPEGRANFHIFYKVGAVQETDAQNGLAHFLEHMAFNGSKHFTENELIDYLHSIGLRFGENLNAMTGQEMTTYMVTNVPTELRPTVLDSVMLVLHDWAGFISLNHKDIDEERGVITEEWRSGNSAGRRVFEQMAPVMYDSTIYAYRNVIGNEQQLKSFSYAEIEDFYHKWYRPDLMAFFVVGDFDVNEMEARLKRIMADIPEAAVKTPRATVVFPENDKPLIAIVTDPEYSANNLQLIFRHDPKPMEIRGLNAAYYSDMVTSLIGSMLNQRFSEIAKRENAPFLGAGGGYSQLAEPSDAFFASASSKDNGLLTAFEAVYTELLRMQRGGFTESELTRAKTNRLRSLENAYENRADRNNQSFVNEYMNHFSEGEPFTWAEKELEIGKAALGNINIEIVNMVASQLITDKNIAITFAMPEKETVVPPTTEQVLASIDKVKALDIELYKDEVADAPLMSPEAIAALKGSKIKADKKPGMYGSKAYTLGNGIRVIVKPTDFSKDQIIMASSQKGGTSLITDLNEMYNIGSATAVASSSGVSDFTQIQLGKMLTGKIASAGVYIGSLTQGINGSCSPKDLETMLQLAYLRYTAPRFSQEDFNVMMSRARTNYENSKNNPNFIFSDSLSKIVYGHNPMVFTISDEILAAQSLSTMEELYKRYFSNAYGMTFTFVGNIDEATFLPLVQKYLGSLPSKKTGMKWGDNVHYPVAGIVDETFDTKMETPLLTFYRIYTGTVPYSLRESICLDAARYILNMRYTKQIREEKGGTYGVGTGLSFQKDPKSFYTLTVTFRTDTSKIAELEPIVQQVIDDLVRDGVTDEELSKTTGFFLKKFTEGFKDNWFWQGYLNRYYFNDFDGYTEYEALVNSLTPADIQAAAKAAFTQGNEISIIQKPQ